MSHIHNNAIRASLFPWTIVRLLPNLQRITVGRFRRRSDAEGHLQVLQRLIPLARFAIVFEVESERLTTVIPQLQTQLPQQQIAAFCQRWKIQEFYLFGSVLRQDFRPDSDIDVMVSFQANAPWGLLELVRMKRELETIVGREVDLVTKQSIEQSENWIRRQEILGTAQLFYVAG